MNTVWLRPDLKTAGGEVNDIVFKNRFAGTLALVYREGDRIAGSVQLEQEVLASADQELVYEFVQSYIQSLMDAIGAETCEVMVTCSSFDQVIAADTGAEDAVFGEEDGYVSVEEDLDQDSGWIDYDSRLEDESPYDREEYSLGDFELVVVNEEEDHLEFHLYDAGDDWLAEAHLQIEDREVIGQVNWLMDPGDEELDAAADLLVLYFDEEEVDSFAIQMVYDGEIIESLELTHEDLLEQAEESGEWVEDSDSVFPGARDYTIVLARDDGDVLTYEIYQQSRGGLPIGTATIDISQRQLTGFIDFRDPGSSGDREFIATLLMEELDKEKDYEIINLTMMHENQLIEEVLFETEQIH